MPRDIDDGGRRAVPVPAVEPTVVRVRGAVQDAEILGHRLWAWGPAAVGEETVGDMVLLTAGFDEARDAAVAAAALVDVGAELCTVDRDSWVDQWRRGVAPVEVGRFRLGLPEHEARTCPPDSIELVIEPGAMFGYGHVTTRLALELLDRLDLGGRTVADVGCGTGVLAIAAALAGAASPVRAVDIDPQAVAITSTNADRNGVAVSVGLGSVEAVGPAHDVVLANLTAATLTQLAPQLVGAVVPGGLLVLSGMLASQADAVVKAFGLPAEIDRAYEGDWVAVILAH